MDDVRVLLFSHDGFGLGHVRRNALIARALHRTAPVQVTVVTGVVGNPAWLPASPIEVVRLPPLFRGSNNLEYSNLRIGTDAAIKLRSALFLRAVKRWRPTVVLVDRFPYGIGGELRAGLHEARLHGALVVLGLRDVLDAAPIVRAEIVGKEWRGFGATYSQILVYAERDFLDQEIEYGLPLPPTYCGWVVDSALPPRRESAVLGIAAGGGGDGYEVLRLGASVLERCRSWRGLVAAGPYANGRLVDRLFHRLTRQDRIQFHGAGEDCRPLYAQATAVVQMGGYNSVLESLAAGHRPIILPRRFPRAEQEVRARLIAERRLADVLDPAASPEDVERLLDEPRHLARNQLEEAGFNLNGAQCAANHLLHMASKRA